MRCGACGYSLEGLSLRSRCPECASFKRDSEDTAEIQRLLGGKLRQSVWVPIACASVSALLGIANPTLGLFVGFFMLMFVGILAEDVSRLRGFLRPQWSMARRRLSLFAHLLIWGAYFLAACVASWRLFNSPLIQSLF